jgi:hypothetical protein
MSLIQAPTPPTEKQKADGSSFRLLQVMKQECKTQFELAWKKRAAGKLLDKSVEECQEFFNSFGDKAALAFELHSKLQELIYMTDNSWVPLVPPHNYAFNVDGTVSISAKETP